MLLKDVAEIKLGLPLDRKKANYISASKIKYKLISLKVFEESTSPNLLYLDEYIATEDVEPYFLTQNNDILIRIRTPATAIYIDENSTGLVISALIASIRVHSLGMVDCEFLAYYLNSRFIQKQLSQNIVGTTIPMVKISDIQQLELRLPSLSVQQQTVCYLKHAEHEINLLQKLTKEKIKLKNSIFETIITNKKELNK